MGVAQRVARLFGKLGAVLVAVKRQKGALGYGKRVCAALLQLCLGLAVVAVQQMLLYIRAVGQLAKGRARLVEAPGVEQPHGVLIARGGDHPDHRCGNGCGRADRRYAQPHDAALAAALGGALDLLFFQHMVVFLARLARRLRQLLLVRGDDVRHIVRRKAGKHGVAPALAAAAAVALQGVGAAAHAQPHLLLHLRKAHGVLAGHKAQLVQRAPGLKGVGLKIGERGVALAPDGGVVEPHLLDHQIDALHVAPLRGQQHDAETLPHARLEPLDALRLAKEQLILLVKAVQRDLYGYDHLVAEVVHDKGAFRVVLRGHGVLPQLHGTGQVDLHRRFPPLRAGIGWCLLPGGHGIDLPLRERVLFKGRLQAVCAILGGVA